MKNDNIKPYDWIDDGLKFKCTGCGLCCTGEPGYVWVSPNEANDIANFLDISLEEFLSTYTHLEHGQVTLKEKEHNDCVFFKDNQCSIYPHRPKQCRTYPFWPQVIRSKETWDEEANVCEGINHPEGKIYTREEIISIAKEASSWIG